MTTRETPISSSSFKLSGRIEGAIAGELDSGGIASSLLRLGSDQIEKLLQLFGLHDRRKKSVSIASRAFCRRRRMTADVNGDIVFTPASDRSEAGRT